VKFTSLKLPPGFYQNGTPEQAAGRWARGNGVRFHEGNIGPIGGWVPVRTGAGTNFVVTGRPRAAIGWSGADGTPWMVIGTHTALVAYNSGVVTPITPVGLGAGSENSTITVGSGGRYGEGLYGQGIFGQASLAGALVPPATWTFDTLGEFLVACRTDDGRVFVWQRNPLNPAAVASGAPINCRAVFVTPEGFLVALGAEGNVRRVYWAAQGTFTDWNRAATTETSAGDFDLACRAPLVAGRRLVSESLLWTEAELFGMQFTGGDFQFSFREIGVSCGLIAPNAVVTQGGTAIWMSNGNFFTYDGYVKQLPCEVRDEVFGNINLSEANKIVCYTNAEFGEVTWHYPSAVSLENDRYVTFNYREGHWVTGTLARGAGFDRGAFDYPILVDTNGNVFEHERGNQRAGMTPFLESGPIAPDPNARVVTINALQPDERTIGETRLILYATFDMVSSYVRAFAPILMQGQTPVRITGRYLRLRIEEAVPDREWRVGVPRVAIVGRGER